VILTAAVVAVRSIPVATKVRVVVLSIAAHDGRTLTMVAKAIDLVSPAVVIVSEPVAPGIGVTPFLSSTVAVPVAVVVNVVLNVT
jgi:hypothetical protein